MFLSLLGGCSSGGSNSTTVTTSDSLAAGLATAFCTQQASCGCPTGATPDGGTTPDGAAPDAAVPTTTTTTTTCASNATADAGTATGTPSTCAERETLAAQEQLALLSTAMNEGLLTIDPNIAAACIAAYQGRACTATASASVDVQAAIDDPACANLFTGYIPIGERCDMTLECAPGGYCLGQATGKPITSINGAGVLGICFGFQESGAPCNTTADCDPLNNLTCNPTLLICE